MDMFKTVTNSDQYLEYQLIEAVLFGENAEEFFATYLDLKPPRSYVDRRPPLFKPTQWNKDSFVDVPLDEEVSIDDHKEIPVETSFRETLFHGWKRIKGFFS